jgi:DNA-binding Lrp family transcriptional regulator
MDSLDDIDLRILEVLERNAKASFREIAGELGIGVSTVSRRISVMEKKGIILGYSTKFDYEKLAKETGVNFFPICFFIRIRSGYEVKRVIEEIARTEYFKDICYIYHVAGDFEIAAMARCIDRKETTKLIESISKIEGVERVTPHAILETYKEDVGPKVSVLRKIKNRS